MQEGAPAKATEYQVSVRRLVEFILRTGNLSVGGSLPRKLRAQEGSRAHRKLQKSRPFGYEAEVALSHIVPSDPVQLEIIGRIDGVWKREAGKGTLLEEIKSVLPTWDYNADPLHWAQIKIYAWIYCQKEGLDELELQLTYFNLDTEEVTIFREKYSRTTLAEFAEAVVNEYLGWIHDYDHWLKLRNRSVEALRFPYSNFRKGQRDLCSAVYKAVLNKGTLFIEAPTGTGKTMSVLFPTIKALPTKHSDRIFFLTAKNTTQQLAQKALADMAAAGLRFRTITLSAKEKVCTIDGKRCDVMDCPMARGYFDRRKPAIQEALHLEHLDREAIDKIAQRHQVCPHELSLDISEWVDAVICDYNYAFDPSAQLKRHFSESSFKNVLLVDEAHNLVDRAREMFSAELASAQFADAKAEVTSSASLKNTFTTLDKAFNNLIVSAEPTTVLNELPSAFLKALEKFVENAETYFAEIHGKPVPEALLDCYFSVGSFLQIAELFDIRYRAIIENSDNGTRIRLLCLDPSSLLHKALERAEAAVFFSATLTPLDYFRSALGGEPADLAYKLQSPFPPENLEVLVASNIKTSFKHRTASIEEVCGSIAAFVNARTGNYLVFFPSYAYLNEVLPGVQALASHAEFIVQTSSMADSERESFLNAFRAQRDKTIVGFAVMGGIFGEGIDLMGDRLIGVAVVGLGLPQLGLERNLIRNHFDSQGVDGFDYAYLFPGLNRVFQAAGRLIRSETDRGAVLLVDSRFTEDRVSRLLPRWWNVIHCPDEQSLKKELQRFWSDPTPQGSSA